MKDAHQRIFRQLEKTGGRDGFDMIVGAAVLSYGSLRAPSDAQARDFARLVLSLWDKVTPETRRSLSAGLSHSPRVPRAVVERLIAEPIEISAPFLMSSPALGEAELKALALSPDRRLRKLVAERRRGPATPAARAPASVSATTAAPAPREQADASPAGKLSGETSIEDEAKARRLDDPAGSERRDLGSTHHPALPSAFERFTGYPPGASGDSPAIPARASMDRHIAPPLVPDFVPDSPAAAEARVETPQAARSAAAAVRETLMRLALPGRRPAQAILSTGPAPTLADLVALAVRQDGARFYDGLVKSLGLSPEMLRRMVVDETGEQLAVALKAMGAGQADAMTVLMMMKQSIGLDVEAFERMTRYYRALNAADCAALTSIRPGARRDAPMPAPALRSSHQETATVRTEPRQTFGRRKALPGEAGSDKRSA